MKIILCSFLFIFLFGVGTTETFACSCIEIGLGKRFKEAKAVFIGKVADEVEIPDDNNLIQGDGVQTLKVIKSWKGIKKKFVDINFDLESAKYGGMCPVLLQLEEGKDYLIFAYGKEYKIQPVCSDTRELDQTSAYYEYQEKQMNKLNSFWFRFWEKIKPF